MRKGKGTDLSSALRSLGGFLDRKSGGSLAQVRIAEAWEAVAGQGVCEHTTGTHLRQGELVIKVDSGVWATELSSLAEQYRVALNEMLGQETVRSVRFTVSREVGDKRKRLHEEHVAEKARLADMVDTIPLTEQELRQVEASAAGIEDEELREVAIRATVADLEWKKGIAATKRREAEREGL